MRYVIAHESRLGDLLVEWTHHKSVGDLARCMSLNVAVSG